MFKNHKEISTIFNILVATVLLLSLCNFLENYEKIGTIVDYTIFMKCFKNLDMTLIYVLIG